MFCCCLILQMNHSSSVELYIVAVLQSVSTIRTEQLLLRVPLLPGLLTLRVSFDVYLSMYIVSIGK